MTYEQWLILKRMRDAHKRSGHWPEENAALDAAVDTLEFIVQIEPKPKPTPTPTPTPVAGSWRDRSPLL